MRKHHVQLLSRLVAEKVRKKLEEDGFRIGRAPYAAFEAVGDDVRVTYYTSGKLLVQGAGTEGLLLRLLDLLGAAPAEDRGPLAITAPTIGSDESGKGDYFGSLVVAGCLLAPEDVPFLRSLGVRDSKLASDTSIERVEGAILNRLAVEVVEHEPVEYNELHRRTKNVNRILGDAHAEVIRRLLARAEGRCRHAVVDRFGGEHYVKGALGPLAADLELTQIPRAEANPAVAAASFVARARFVRSLARLSDEVGVDLLPGASAAVEETARTVVRIGGAALLAKVAKLHFRTTERVLGPGAA